MIKTFITWLYALYFTPAAAFSRAKKPQSEVDTVTDITASDTTDTVPDTAPVAAAIPLAPSDEIKTGVADFETAYSFVVSGIEQLGAAAEDELKALVKKYL